MGATRKKRFGRSGAGRSRRTESALNALSATWVKIYQRLCRNNLILSLDKVIPGIASDETSLYGVEIKSYANKEVLNQDFETSVQGLRAIGDGASVTRWLQQASANGLTVARSILKKL